ncbi:hypothetical protein PDE_02429 [Penicillium oxalicum 114-2]|uniref:CMP/dCMP-type deaminase domain-containing protein n=1 Tax=Penicillium oxalicum (strain 114-2 / CGMCC 5302) TaxID=933388 RepID=S7ZFQ1_PENO1|nr:hypothetical protein PDE_02429 [Penicillium oxalicum 114-2]
MDAAEIVRAIKPLKGNVIPIKTIQETQPPEDFADAFVAEINVKSASSVIKVLDSNFPRDEGLPMGHLRRFAKRNMIPEKLLAAIEAESSPEWHDGQTLFVMIPPPVPDADTLLELLAPFAPRPRRRSSTTPPRRDSATPSTGPSSPTSQPAALPSTNSNPSESQVPQIRLFTTRVPIYPPLNIKQADQWTKMMWPVVYNPAAPRASIAPPPQILKGTLHSIQPRAGHYLALAHKVAEEAQASGRGRAVGAVIVDPTVEQELESRAWVEGSDSTENWMEAVLAVAGDVRFARAEGVLSPEENRTLGHGLTQATSHYEADIEGGPDLHALMRAAELIARRRREEDDDLAEVSEPALPVVLTDPQLSNQLSPLESYFLYENSKTTNVSEPEQSMASTVSPKKRKHEESVTTWSHEPKDLSLPAASSAVAWDENPFPISAVDGQASPSGSHDNRSASPDSRIRTRSQGGYLCTGLDIYLTHEPCVCCSMGMLLSRFRAVIFLRKGRLPTGGIASEPVVKPTPDDDAFKEQELNSEGREYYGLHWRKELNWRALGFEFVETELNEAGEAVMLSTKDDGSNEVVFHA